MCRLHVLPHGLRSLPAAAAAAASLLLRIPCTTSYNSCAMCSLSEGTPVLRSPTTCAYFLLWLLVCFLLLVNFFPSVLLVLLCVLCLFVCVVCLFVFLICSCAHVCWVGLRCVVRHCVVLRYSCFFCVDASLLFAAGRAPVRPRSRGCTRRRLGGS